MITLMIQGPKIIKDKNMATIFGINANVTSWIWLTAWKTLMTKPTSNPITKAGADAKRTVINACLIM